MPKVAGKDYYLGIDPGKSSGGASILYLDGHPFAVPNWHISFSKVTEHEIGVWFREHSEHIGDLGGTLKAALEKVHSMPQQSAQSGFSFGANYGLLRGLLIAFQIPFIEPPPQRWQKALSCMSHGDKNVTKAKAHELWPLYTKQITHAAADSLLIAEYLRLSELRK